jgi:inosose dehydratase
MQGENMRADTGQTRRQFLQVAGAGAAASVMASGPSLPEALAAEQQPGPARPASRPFELGLASYTFMKFTLEQTLAMTARVGLKKICLKSFHLALEASPEQIAEAAAKVKKAGLDLYGGGVISMRNEKEVNQAFEYAKAAGMKTIVGVPLPDVLPLVNDKVQQYGIRVAIHNHGPGDKVYPAPQDAYEKIKTLDKRIGLCIDVGHTLRNGVDPARAARQCADRLLDVHMKDVSAATAAGQTVEVGRGVIDILKFLRTLVEIRFSGVVAFEFEKDPKDPLAGLAESVGYVKGVLAVI